MYRMTKSEIPLDERAPDVFEKEKRDFLKELKLVSLNIVKTRRNFKDFLFHVILGIGIIIIIMPFFLVLYQVASVGFIELLSNGFESFSNFFLTEPGRGLMGGIRNAFFGTLFLIALASAVGIPLRVFGAVYINE